MLFPLTAHRSPLTAHRSPLTAHRSPLTAQSVSRPQPPSTVAAPLPRPPHWRRRRRRL